MFTAVEGGVQHSSDDFQRRQDSLHLGSIPAYMRQTGRGEKRRRLTESSWKTPSHDQLSVHVIHKVWASQSIGFLDIPGCIRLTPDILGLLESPCRWEGSENQGSKGASHDPRLLSFAASMHPRRLAFQRSQSGDLMSRDGTSAGLFPVSLQLTPKARSVVATD
jgi:hypothetical protein